MTDAIHIEGLCKKYADFQLNHVTFSLPKGCILGFVGENGAGKTTTIKAILNLISIDSGSISVLGLDHKKKERAIKEQIGVVFDNSGFHSCLTPDDIELILRRIYKNWDSALYRDYLKKFALAQNKQIKQFSKGMTMKLNIAAALAHRPRLLILDEATSGLDPIVREEILDIFLDFIQDEEHSVLISSHITSDLDKIADYIAFIHNGSIVFSRPKDELVGRMGILKCSASDFQKLGASEILRYRKSQFGYEALLDDRYAFARRHPGTIVDPTNIEEIMLFYARGEVK